MGNTGKDKSQQLENSPSTSIPAEPLNISDTVSNDISSVSNQVNQSIEKTLTTEEQINEAVNKLRNYQIIHLEDESAIRKMISRVFIRKNLEVISLSTAQELMAAIESASVPTVILSDNNVGGPITGMEIAELTHEIRQQKGIPFVLFCSGPNQEKLESLLSNKAIDSYIEKPTDGNALIIALGKSAK